MNGPGILQGHSPVFVADSSIPGAARPIDDVSSRRHEPFAHQLTPAAVGVVAAVGIVVVIVIVIVPIAITRADPDSERADLNTRAAAAGAHKYLRGSRHSCQNRSGRQRGKYDFPHGHSSKCCPRHVPINASAAVTLHLRKFYMPLEPIGALVRC